jgi:hypothetical protein
MELLNVASWSGVPLLILLILGITQPKYRALAIATLLIVVPLSIILAANNNHTNEFRNFFMGIIMFGVPLMTHAALVSFIKQRQ